MALEWVKIDKDSGTMDDTVKVSAEAHTGREARAAIVKGKTAGGASDTSEIRQAGLAAFIRVATASFSIGNTGGTAVITGTANTATLSIVPGDSSIDGVRYTLAVNEKADTSWNGDSDTTVDGDPGAEAQYTFKITCTVPENQTDGARVQDLTIEGGGAKSPAVKVSQAAGVKAYSDVKIKSFTYADIPAKGGTVSPSLSYEQTWGWNGKTTGGGTITTGASLSYSGSNVDTTSGAVTAPTKGTAVSDETTFTTSTVKVTLNGKSASDSETVKQLANSVSYGEVSISGGTVSDIPASGGSVSSASGLAASQTLSYTSGSTKAGSVTVSYNSVSAGNLGTTVKSRTKVGTLTATAKGEGGKTATRKFEVYQQENAVTAYGDVTIVQTTPVNLKAPGQTYTFTPTLKQTLTYTSGETGAGSVTASYAVKTAKDGFTLSSGKVTVGENPTVNERGGFVVTITATGQGGKTATMDVTFTQQGSESEIAMTPAEVSVEASGGSRTITIESNDSWTLTLDGAEVEHYLEVSPPSLTFDAGGGTLTLEIDTDEAWTIE